MAYAPYTAFILVLLCGRIARTRWGAGVDRAALDCGILHLCFQNVRLLHEAVDEQQMGFAESLLHEGNHHDVTLHVDIFSQPQSVFRHPESQFLRLFGFPRETAAKGPAALDIKTQRSVAVCLDPVRKVVEAAGVGDFARGDTAGYVVDFVGDLVPGAVVFFGGRVAWRLDRVALDDERVEIDHLDVGVEGTHDTFACDPRRNRGDGGEDGSFGHDCADSDAGTVGCGPRCDRSQETEVSLLHTSRLNERVDLEAESEEKQ